MFDQLIPELKVHDVHPNGMHSETTMLHIHDWTYGVVDVFVRHNGHIHYNCATSTVMYRETPTAYSWHFLEET